MSKLFHKAATRPAAGRVLEVCRKEALRRTMLQVVLHRLILAVTLIAFTGGMTLQLMPPKAAFAASEPAPVTGDCADMAMMPAEHGAGHDMPCKGMDPECIKQMHCLGTPSLPLRLGNAFTHFA